MLQLAKDMDTPEFSIVMGYRDAQTFLLDEFEKVGKTFVATENGSVGTCGTVLDAIQANHLDAEVIYACGPTPMLRALAVYAKEKNIDCFVSMEERMACGIGACLACVCQSKETDAHTNVKNKRVCKEGPVFDAREVELS
jgi:dihydroorotate dehydrogenase electron transfer subunit